MKDSSKSEKTKDKELKNKLNKDDPCYKKINKLKKLLITLLTILLSISIFILGLFYYDNLKTKHNSEAKLKLQREISDLKEKSSSIEEKISSAIRFGKIWHDADPKRKNFDGIKISVFSEKVNSIVKKYNFTNLSINVSPIEVLTKDIYNEINTINVNLIKCVISFDSVSDVETIKFIEELKNSLTGYFAIQDLTIKKSKKEGYEEKELVDISSGNGSGIISNKIVFSWYFLTLKNQTTSPENKK